MKRLALSIALAYAGCAEAPTPTAQHAPVPPMVAPRQAGAWQQFCEQATTVQQASLLASARGADGFELVAMFNGVLCYKKPLSAAPETRPPATPAVSPYVPAVKDPGF